MVMVRVVVRLSVIVPLILSTNAQSQDMVTLCPLEMPVSCQEYLSMNVVGNSATNKDPLVCFLLVIIQ